MLGGFTLHFLLQLHAHAQSIVCCPALPLPLTPPHSLHLLLLLPVSKSRGPCVASLRIWPDFKPPPPTSFLQSQSLRDPHSSPPPGRGGGDSVPLLHLLHLLHPLRPLTVPQRESTGLMDATDGPFPWSSQPRRSVCSSGSEANPLHHHHHHPPTHTHIPSNPPNPHEMHVVTGNKRRASVPDKSRCSSIPVLLFQTSKKQVEGGGGTRREGCQWG